MSESIWSKAKHLVVDDDPESNQQSAKPVPPAAGVPFTFAPPTSAAPTLGASSSLSSLVGAASVSSSSPEAEDAYQKLLGKTDFEKTDIALTIQKYAIPLANIIPDPQTRFRAAVASAQAQAGVSPDAVLATFDSLRAQLIQAEESFKTKAAAFEQREITARESRLTEIANQLAALQAEQTRLSGELTEAKAKSARTQSAYTAANQRRGAEIDQQKAQYAALLKG